MTVSFNMFKKILDTLPISYYLGSDIKVNLEEKMDKGHFFNPLSQEITLSYPTMIHMFDKIADIEEEELHLTEQMIRGCLYHEISHVFLTPPDLKNINNYSISSKYGINDTTAKIELFGNVINVFEDERMETYLKNFYYGVNFRKNIILLNNWQGEEPTNAFSDFYHVVRFRTGKPEFVTRVDEIIDRYDTKTINADTMKSNSSFLDYQADMVGLFLDVAKDWYEENDPQALKDIDPNYDDQDEDVKKRDVASAAAKDMQSHVGDSDYTMPGMDGTVIVLTDGDPSSGKPLTDEEAEALADAIEKGDVTIIDQRTGESEDSGEDKEGEDAISDNPPKIKKPHQPMKPHDHPNLGIPKVQEMLSTKSNKFIDNDLTEKIKQVFQDFTARTKNQGSANLRYSGRLDPRQIGREDWRIWQYKSLNGPIKGYDKLHLNLFIDTSGSFYNNEDKVNTILNSLNRLETLFPFFEYDLVTCQVGETLRNKNERYIKTGGGNDLDDNIHKIFKTLQNSKYFNINIALFDGDAFTDCRGGYEHHQKNFGVFNSTNCSIISDSDNKNYINQYAPQAHRIFVEHSYSGSRKSYADMLFDNIIQALTLALI